jgi:hypothetical protein
MIVGSTQCRDVTSAQFADIGKTAAAPTETLGAEALNQKIGRQAGMTAISVWKRVDGDQSMVKPDRNFIRRKCLILDPIADVA